MRRYKKEKKNYDLNDDIEILKKEHEDIFKLMKKKKF